MSTRGFLLLSLLIYSGRNLASCTADSNGLGATEEDVPKLTFFTTENGTATQLGNDKYELKVFGILKNKFFYTFNDDVKCTEVKYQDALVWKYDLRKDSGNYPYRVTYNKTAKTLFVVFEEKYYGFLVVEDKWKRKIEKQAESKRPRLRTEQETEQEKPAEGEDGASVVAGDASTEESTEGTSSVVAGEDTTVVTTDQDGSSAKEADPTATPAGATPTPTATDQDGSSVVAATPSTTPDTTKEGEGATPSTPTSGEDGSSAKAADPNAGEASTPTSGEGATPSTTPDADGSSATPTPTVGEDGSSAKAADPTLAEGATVVAGEDGSSDKEGEDGSSPTEDGASKESEGATPDAGAESEESEGATPTTPTSGEDATPTSADGSTVVAGEGATVVANEESTEGATPTSGEGATPTTPDAGVDGTAKAADSTGTPSLTPVELNIKNDKAATDKFDYVKDKKNKTATYTCKQGFGFSLVKQKTTELWKAKDQSEYANKVVVKGVGSKEKTVTIHLANGKTVRANKKKNGCCGSANWSAPEEAITPGSNPS